MDSDRLISAEKLVINLAKKNRFVRIEDDDIMAVIADAPTVDAGKVVHGRWEKPSKYGMGHKFNHLGVVCSACVSWMDNPYNYCPNCGAKMDEEA